MSYKFSQTNINGYYCVRIGIPVDYNPSLAHF